MRKIISILVLVGMIAGMVFCSPTKDNGLLESITSPTTVICIETEQEIDLQKLNNEEFKKKNSILKNVLDDKEYFIAYQSLIEEYKDWIKVPQSIYEVYLEEDIYLMQRCIETEVYGGDFQSKCNVASVILNRVNGDVFPNTPKEVVVKNQFCFSRKNISEDTKLALEYAFMMGDTTQGALFFHSGEKTNTFSGAQYLFSDNAVHHFYGNIK